MNRLREQNIGSNNKRPYLDALRGLFSRKRKAHEPQSPNASALLHKVESVIVVEGSSPQLTLEILEHEKAIMYDYNWKLKTSNLIDKRVEVVISQIFKTRTRNRVTPNNLDRVCGLCVASVMWKCDYSLRTLSMALSGYVLVKDNIQKMINELRQQQQQQSQIREVDGAIKIICINIIDNLMRKQFVVSIESALGASRKYCNFVYSQTKLAIKAELNIRWNIIKNDPIKKERAQILRKVGGTLQILL